MSQVNFHFLHRQFVLKNRKELKVFISTIFKKKKRNLVRLQVIFCSDAFLLDINQQFLQHDYYTDVITFNLGTEDSIDAEIYISIDRVKDNAQSLGKSFKEEIHRVIFHGALHLCGYKDKLKRDKEEMRREENRLLDLYFNTNQHRST